ncbi:hypothetical protein ONS95_006770 [Cadophora gregata]|uniref:uncharacterized protein n=1 Tax=Cadophora gregata TaxID=51156 RepID=UPI0026DA85B5|nr:uncharacterized protein ONS95_006770 [Cadophora gregata]KAK0101607.1 hypothetical protein ONS95_006770 [Cadophora gregata]
MDYEAERITEAQTKDRVTLMTVERIMNLVDMSVAANAEIQPVGQASITTIQRAMILCTQGPAINTRNAIMTPT